MYFLQDGSEYLHLQTELSNALEKNQNITHELDHLKDNNKSSCEDYIEELVNKQNQLKSLTHKLTEKDEECAALVSETFNNCLEKMCRNVNKA